MLYSATLNRDEFIADIKEAPLAIHSLALRVVASSFTLNTDLITSAMHGILKAPPTTSTE